MLLLNLHLQAMHLKGFYVNLQVGKIKVRIFSDLDPCIPYQSKTEYTVLIENVLLEQHRATVKHYKAQLFS